MKSKNLLYALLLILLAPLSLLAQGDPPPGHQMMGAGHGMGMGMGMGQRDGGPGPMGEWWKNSDVAQKLKLTDQQVQQLNKKFLDHRLKLIDYHADTEKQDLKLNTLLDADSPDEGQVGSQVDQVLAARGKLEREFTMMTLDLRKVLSVDQWKQLQAIRRERGGPGGPMFHREGDMRPGMMGHPGTDRPGMGHQEMGHSGMAHSDMDHPAPPAGNPPPTSDLPAPPAPSN